MVTNFAWGINELDGSGGEAPFSFNYGGSFVPGGYTLSGTQFPTIGYNYNTGSSGIFGGGLTNNYQLNSGTSWDQLGTSNGTVWNPTTGDPGSIIPVNQDPTVIGSGAWNPNVPQQTVNPGDFPAGHGVIDPTQQTSSQLGFPGIIPLPVDPLTAIGLTLVLNSGGGGGGGIMGPTAPAGSSNTGLVLTGDEPVPTGVGPVVPIIPPSTSNNQNNEDTPTQQTVVPVNPTAPVTNPPVVNEDTGKPTQQTVVPLGPGAPATNPPTVTNTDDNPPRTLTVVPVGPGAPATNPPTVTQEPGTTPINPVVLPISPPVVPPPTVTPPPSTPPPPVVKPENPMPNTPTQPLWRNYFTEGQQSTSDLSTLLPQIFGLYKNASGSYGQNDLQNYQNIQPGYNAANLINTGNAALQTQLANRALRQGNLEDVQTLGGSFLQARREANPGLYGPMDTYTQQALSNLDRANADIATSKNLSPEDMRAAQQSAREAWSARGLVNSNGAVGAEILNRDALQRQRYNEALGQQQQAMGNVYSAIGANTANIFDPAAAVLGAQYGNQTNNAGTNTALFNQGVGFSSGAYGNQYVQNMYNPYNTYSNDVYGSNFNAANAQYISQLNNNAAMQGANTAANAQLANSFLNTLFNVGKSSGWWG